MDNCQVLCGYKNTRILIQEPPRFLLKPPPLPPQELLNSSFYFLNNQCDLFTKLNSSSSLTKTSTNSNISTQSTTNDYNLFIVLLYSCLILFSILILFAIIYLVLTRRNLKLKLKKEQQEHQNNLDNHTSTINKFHTIISNITSSPTITATTGLSGPVINGFIPEIQLNNSNTSSTSSYEYYMNNRTNNNNKNLQHRFDYQKQKICNYNENDCLLSKLDYYTLRAGGKNNHNNRIIRIIDDDSNLKPLIDKNSPNNSISTTNSVSKLKNEVYSNKYATISDDNINSFSIHSKQQQNIPLLILCNKINNHRIYETLKMNNNGGGNYFYENNHVPSIPPPPPPPPPIDIIYEHINDEDFISPSKENKKWRNNKFPPKNFV